MKDVDKVSIRIWIAIGVIALCWGVYEIGYTDGVASVPIPVPEPPEPPVVFDIDGVGCVISEQPVLTYYVATHTVRVNIECDPDLLMYHLPAVEAPEETHE